MKLHRIEFRSLAWITAGFIVCTAGGVLLHEGGHILVAKILGYETKLHYASMNWGDPVMLNALDSIHAEYQYEIENGLPFPEEERYAQIKAQRTNDSLLITMGGPAQTMLSGIIGLMILFCRRGRMKIYGLKTLDWIAVFLSLFWLREILNLIMGVAKGIISSERGLFGSKGDEVRISTQLGLWEGTLPIVLGIIGLGLSLLVIFRFVPVRLRATFILGGLLGGVIGYVAWMHLLGPVVLP